MYISQRGFQTLCDIRAGTPPDVTGSPSVELLASLPSEECGCPEEIWVINGYEVLIHFEEDGSSEMVIYTGDNEHEIWFDDCLNMHDLRAKMFRYFAQVEERT